MMKDELQYLFDQAGVLELLSESDIIKPKRRKMYKKKLAVVNNIIRIISEYHFGNLKPIEYYNEKVKELTPPK